MINSDAKVTISVSLIQQIARAQHFFKTALAARQEGVPLLVVFDWNSYVERVLNCLDLFWCWWWQVLIIVFVNYSDVVELSLPLCQVGSPDLLGDFAPEAPLGIGIPVIVNDVHFSFVSESKDPCFAATVGNDLTLAYP